MPRKDKTGPVGIGPRDGLGKGVDGRGSKGTQKGQGARSGGK